ncbi:MAG TPA: FAD-dependent monooxygenase [Luteibacter sp.]|jgi:2-polyprenyl-6-methoxyphenol hydroxylase-like FAD-dependent oxidoreductase|nr:FAD-dependent monooxygenase [Luteibacter sp.]
MATSTTQVLIVGAGPTGLMLALGLAARGVRFRIVDKKAGPGEASRAMVVQARTLEFYRQLGFAEALVAEGIRIEHLHVRKHGKEAAAIDITDIGTGISPYPFVLSYPQDDHERFLVGRLRKLGIEVEWNTALDTLDQDADGVHAVLANGDAIEVGYLCGCDGARSVVRESLRLGFPGGTYAHMFYVADVKAAGPFQMDLSMNLDAEGFALVLPVRSRGVQRLIGVVPEALSGRDDLGFEDIRERVEQLSGIQVEELNWFSSYRVHHRVADHFRAGRCFVAGDAGHVHSPVGGQGMNTGIGDAFNLAWKLADVLAGHAGASLLDTYETERIAFARSLVATTDRAFQNVIGLGIGSRLLRGWIVPHVMPALVKLKALRRLMFDLVSQVRIEYRASALSEGTAGRIHGGDRLPWVDIPRDGDNFAPLRSLDWQVHVYGNLQPTMRDACTRHDLAAHAFPWSQQAGHAGLLRDAVYLVRPDGYVAWASEKQDPAALVDYLGRKALRVNASG